MLFKSFFYNNESVSIVRNACCFLGLEGLQIGGIGMGGRQRQRQIRVGSEEKKGEETERQMEEGSRRHVGCA